MRVSPVAIALSILLGRAVCAEPSTDVVTRLKSCFQLNRELQDECLENLSRELSTKDDRGSVLPAESTWVISETTSPLDYSPMVTAALLSHPSARDAPATFAVRCRSQRTDLIISTEGSWRASGGEFQVTYRINDLPATKLRWSASADGRSAVFRGDGVRFLRALPDRGLLKISLTDRDGAAHEAVFPLSGLDAVRRKIGTACKWAPADTH